MPLLRKIPLPVLLLSPTLVFLTLFFLIPLIQVSGLAFQSQDSVFTLANFERMVRDIYFDSALRNTVVLLILIIPVQLVLAFGAALIVNQRFRGSTFFLYIYAIPLGISDLAAGLIWLSIFTERGYLNSLMHNLGVLERPLIFLSSLTPKWMIAAIVLTEVWRATPLVMVILLSGLQMIAKDYIEAADTFGCSWWQKVRYVILPLLKPSIQSALIMRTMLAFQMFGPILVLAGRQLPVFASESYYWYTTVRNPRVAAAYALMLMALSLVATWIYLVVLRTREEQVGVM
ncbi:MAG: carbohydrate ABC transporter permease [Limnochordia bacterium]|jgi:multiple sugar transport system permease protein|nr:MAG: ABC transporter permease [Peptococcaceae bacterium 1109]